MKNTPERIRETQHLELMVKTLLEKEGGYLSSSEISRRLSIPRTTILSKGVRTDEVALSLGFKRPGRKSKGGNLHNQEYISDLSLKWKLLIEKKGEAVSLYKFGESFGLPYSKISGFYRLGLDPKKIHEECGVEYHQNKKMCSKTNATKKLRELIRSKKRYITRDELAEELGVSGSLISLRGIPITETNLEFGYTPDWRAYEMYVKEIFDKFRPGYTLELQKTFEGCQSSRDGRSKLKYDFYCEELRLLIEVDGPSHFDANNQWHTPELVKRDALKTEFAKMNEMTLIRIPYNFKYSRFYVESFLSGIPLKHSVGQPAAKLEEIQEGSTTSRKT